MAPDASPPAGGQAPFEGPNTRPTSASALKEVAGLFLKLGCIAFGGPAAHIAMMRDEVVRRRGWVSEQQFLDLVGGTNLIPGPNSTEMAIHLGYLRAGWWGLIAGGSLFIAPAMLIVLALAWIYVDYGSTPEVEWLLYGIKPVIIGIVMHALWGLGRTAVKGPVMVVVGAAVLMLFLLGVNELLLLAAGGIAVMLANTAPRLWRRGTSALLLFPLALPSFAAPAAGALPFSLLTLFLKFLKIGSVLYGSGYVLLAFVRADFVERLGWLSDQQLIDAIAVGQFTPGPVFTTATFIGYVAGHGRVLAALVATIGIFLPSFVFVALLSYILPLVRQSPWARTLLDGVNVASLGLMAGVTWQLGQAAVVDLWTAVLAVVALVVVFGVRLNSAWLVVGGGLAGVLLHLLGVG